MRSARRRGPLGAGELAEAVVLADLTLVLSIVSHVLPYLGGALLVIAVVPMAAIAARNRLRAVAVGAIAAAAVGFMVLGTPVVISVLACAAMGAVVGGAARRGWGLARTVGAAALFLWPMVAVVIDLWLWVFSENRELVLAQLRNTARGASNVLLWISARLSSLASWLNFDPAVEQFDDFVTRFLDWWWVSIPLVLLAFVVMTAWLAQRITAPTLRRVRDAFATDGDDIDHDTAARVNDASPGGPIPVPVELRNVDFRYPGATVDVLHGISIAVAPSELVAIVGPNGSGKSTLARCSRAGRQPRVRSCDPGRPASAPLVELRSCSSGPSSRRSAFAPATTWFGVSRSRSGSTSRRCSTASGSLCSPTARPPRCRAGSSSGWRSRRRSARRPQLLISDESTAMVDAEGRQQLLALLRSLASDDHMAVVHVTHRAAETAAADRAIALDAGRVVPEPMPIGVDPMPPRVPATPAPKARGPLFVLRGVGHVYSRRTPWAHRALADIDLRIDPGEAMLVVGHNGSGKSTLAWVLAGLLEPSEGDARIEGDRITTVVGQIGVAFQHARLQLLRPTVASEVPAASGASTFGAWQALRDVGLDPQELGPRRVDELSGGQARRVVLAGAIAGHPRALVLDEPFAGLDDHGRAELTAALARLRSDRGLTLVCVSHDRDLPAALVDREVELVGGRISYDGPRRATDHDIARGNLP